MPVLDKTGTVRIYLLPPDMEGISEFLTAPEVEIQVQDIIWKEFLNSITFGTFFREKQEVTITAENMGSSMGTLWYYISNQALSPEEVEALGEEHWSPYEKAFSIAQDNRYVIYAKAVDAAGNVTYCSSDGLVLDSTALLVQGLENEGVYYGDQTFTVDDENGVQVNIDGTGSGDGGNTQNPDDGNGSDNSDNENTTLPQETVTPEEIRKNSEKLDSGISISWNRNKFILSWKKADRAEGYDIFAAPCGEKKLDAKSLIRTTEGENTSVSFAKNAGRKISGKKSYKFKIKAWRYVDGKKVYIGSSKCCHVVGKINKKYTNVEKLKPAKTKYVLKKGKGVRIGVTVVKQSKKKKLLPKSHGPALRYASSDYKIAAVTPNGVVKAKKKGSCYITVTALNGVNIKIKITVK